MNTRAPLHAVPPLEPSGRKLVLPFASSPTEGHSLEQLEQTIRGGLDSFLAVGSALLEIRERRLYREQGYTNFALYCQRRWGLGRNYADKQIRAAAAVKEMDTMVSISPPATEGQARELAKVEDPKERAEVWKEAVTNHETPTAKEIASLRKRKRASKKAPAESGSPALDLEGGPNDGMGTIVPIPSGENTVQIPDPLPASASGARLLGIAAELRAQLSASELSELLVLLGCKPA